MDSATTVVSALTTALGTVRDDMLSALVAIIPLALAVATPVLVVSVGWKMFRKFAK